MLSILTELTNTELEKVSNALNMGTIRAPFTAVGLGRYIHGDRADQVAASLNNISSMKDNSYFLKELIALLVTDRRKVAAGIAEEPTLVWSGPETPGLRNRDTKTVVPELFREAKLSVMIAGYAIFQGKEIFRELATQLEGNPGLQVIMHLNIHGKEGGASDYKKLIEKFTSDFKNMHWPGKRYPSVFYDPRSLETGKKQAVLHSKCVVVDHKTSLVTSANFTERAQKRNIETGVLIRSKDFSEQLESHFEALRREKILVQLKL